MPPQEQEHGVGEEIADGAALINGEMAKPEIDVGGQMGAWTSGVVGHGARPVHRTSGPKAKWPCRSR
jgi:hypothetical protein